jgi:uncharacterized Ntn-hydrolase superfamily protein
MTYSIVARCPTTGRLGIGIASHVLAVGRVALYVEPGLGAVATQSLVLMAHGRRTLDGLRAGLGPAAALAASLDLDDEAAVRQVGVVDASGQVIAHTGERCIPHASHVLGDGFTCQANMMANPGVPEAMAAGFTADPAAPLPERLLAALDAAEAAGGDIRGRQSAALVVAMPEPTGDVLLDRVVDVRVDDHPEPLIELRRLSSIAVANHDLDRADALLGAGDVPAAAEAYRAATQAAPDYREFAFWQAAALAGAGMVEDARAVWAGLVAAPDAPRWRTLLRRVAQVELVAPEVVTQLDPDEHHPTLG